MNTISLWEPWASCIALGLKRVETRSWPCPQCLIGKPLVIHAAKRWDENNQEFAANLRGELTGYFPPQPQLGNLLCVVTPTHCLQVAQPGDGPPYLINGGPCALCREVFDTPRERLLGDWSPGRYLWLLKDVRRIKPVAFTGRQGIFQVPDEVIQYEEG